MAARILYRALDIDSIVTTADRLHRRIDERFPGAGLAKVALELRNVAGEAGARLERIQRPLVGVRALVTDAIVLIGAVLVAQYLNDPVVLDAVNDVESLASSLSVKIWQKSMILGVITLRAEDGDGVR
jgi:hypothetical protein